MSTIGYNGRALQILKGGTVIAAVRTKSVSHNREPVEVTTDDSDGNRVLLPNPAMRSLDVQVDGVATADNYAQWIADWNGNVFQDITIRHPDGTVEEAENGFFLGNLENSGEHDGAVEFSAQLMSSGPMTIVSST